MPLSKSTSTSSPRSDGLSSLRAFDDRQADVDSVAVKNSCKSLRYDTADPRALDYERRMLSGGAAAKILIRYDNIAFFTFFTKSLSISSIQCLASSYPSVIFKYLAE